MKELYSFNMTLERSMDIIMNCFNVLGIEATNDIKKIKSAYVTLSKKYHPEEYPEEFQRLQEAYKSALKLAKNQKYDIDEIKVTRQENQEQQIVLDFEYKDMQYDTQIGQGQELELLLSGSLKKKKKKKNPIFIDLYEEIKQKTMQRGKKLTQIEISIIEKDLQERRIAWKTREPEKEQNKLERVYDYSFEINNKIADDFSFLRSNKVANEFAELIWNSQKIYENYYIRNSVEAWKVLLEDLKYRKMLKYSFFVEKLVMELVSYENVKNSSVWEYFRKRLIVDKPMYLEKNVKEYLREAEKKYIISGEKEKFTFKQLRIRFGINYNLYKKFHITYRRTPIENYVRVYLVYFQDDRLPIEEKGLSLKEQRLYKSRSRRKKIFDDFKLYSRMCAIIVVCMIFIFYLSGGSSEEIIRNDSNPKQAFRIKEIREERESQLELQASSIKKMRELQLELEKYKKNETKEAIEKYLAKISDLEEREYRREYISTVYEKFGPDFVLLLLEEGFDLE